jgi:ketosteroid isomerase-like protein
VGWSVPFAKSGPLGGGSRDEEFGEVGALGARGEEKQMDDRANDERLLRKLIADWSAAARGRDYDGVMAHHSANILMFDVPPPFQSEGLEGYRKTWDLFVSMMADPPTFDFSDVRLRVGADLAFATARGRCLSRDRDGTTAETHFRLTMCFEKLDGEWVIVHEHHSVPAD